MGTNLVEVMHYNISFYLPPLDAADASESAIESDVRYHPFMFKT